MADTSEQLDAIGSVRDRPVRAATWKRLLYRGITGIATALAILWTVYGVIELVS